MILKSSLRLVVLNSVWLASLIPALSQASKAQEQPLASWLPESAVAYVEFGSADLLLDHPLREKIRQSPEFLKIWRSPDVLKLRSGMTIAELALGDKLENIARKLTDGGLAIAVSAEPEGAALVARTNDAQWLDEYITRLAKLARENNPSGNVEESEYRGIRAFRSDDLLLAVLDDVLLVTNKKELGKLLVDNYLDKVPSSLQDSPAFIAASKRRTESTLSTGKTPSKSFAWGYIDLDAIRSAGIAEQLFSGKADNFATELLLGGLLHTLQHTPSVTADWRLGETETLLTFSAEHDATSTNDAREYFFGPEGKGRGLPLLQSDKTIASLSAYRDVSQLWLRAGDLFDAKVNDELAQADSTLTTLFSGRDFGEEILGAMQPELRLVVEGSEFDSARPIPAIRLPGFALVAQLREPEAMRGELKRIFQSLIGFLNFAGAMEGQPQLDMDMDSVGKQLFYTAQYVREVDREREAAPIQFNFSPSLAFVDEHVILSSTIPLSKELAQRLEGAESQPLESSASNTVLEVDLHAVQAALAENRSQLVAQNMLEKGHSQDEAEGEIDSLMSILSFFDSMRMDLNFDQRAELTATIQLAD